MYIIYESCSYIDKEDRSEAYDFGCGELKDKHLLVKEKMCGSERGEFHI